jgi:hypothetical protein
VTNRPTLTEHTKKETEKDIKRTKKLAKNVRFSQQT